MLEQTILAEANLHDIVETNRRNSKKAYAKDTPNSISLSTRLDPSLTKSIQSQLETAMGDRDSSKETQLQKQVQNHIFFQVKK